jgi:hypothetical protein
MSTDMIFYLIALLKSGEPSLLTTTSGRRHQPYSFEGAIAREDDRLQGEEEKILDDPSYRSINHQHYSYLARQTTSLNWRGPSLTTPGPSLGAGQRRLFTEPRQTHLRAQEFPGLAVLPLERDPRLNPVTY